MKKKFYIEVTQSILCGMHELLEWEIHEGSKTSSVKRAREIKKKYMKDSYGTISYMVLDEEDMKKFVERNNYQFYRDRLKDMRHE